MKIDLYGIHLGPNLMHLLETHKVAVEVLVPEYALPFYRMNESDFLKGIAQGMIPTFVFKGTIVVPTILFDPDICGRCGGVRCQCDRPAQNTELANPCNS